MGWDQDNKTIRSIMQTTSGAQDSGTWTCDGTTLTWSGSGSNEHRLATSATVHFVLTDDNTFTWQIVGQLTDGKPTPDSGLYKFKKE